MMQQMNLVPMELKTKVVLEGSSNEVTAEARLVGSIERIVYFNEDSGQCVLDVKSEEFECHFLVAGSLPSAYPGQNVEGDFFLSPTQWTDLKANGKIEDVLVARHLKTSFPTTGRTLKKFLKSGALSDLGPHLAATLAKAFPENLQSVFRQNSDLLTSVPGIGKKRRAQILEAWKEFLLKSELQEHLFSNHLPLTWARTLWISHGEHALALFRANPYHLAIQHDFEFSVVDPYARNLGFPENSPARIRCGLYDLLRAQFKQGHCAYPEEQLLQNAEAQLKVPLEELENALELEILSDHLVSDTIQARPCVFLKDIWQLERKVADQLLKFEKREPPWGWFNLDKVLNWAQSLLQIQLAPLQVQAIETALSSSLTVITGGPGTGKTTLIRSLVTILQTQFMKFALCSPTGRAAQRLDEATGAPAKTIHRLLKYNSATGSFVHNQMNPLDLDLVLVDEASMVDLRLMSHLLDALPERCALILVGDADQIPPIGAGNVLQSLLSSGRFSTVRLTDIFRQREKSLIKINASRINKGEMPLSEADAARDFHLIEVQGPEQTKKVLLDLVTRVIPEECGIHDPSQFQILVPMNRGELGTLQLNEDLQRKITLRNFHNDREPQTVDPGGDDAISGFGQSYKTGDKVMVLKNDYTKDVFNGDIGFIERIDPSGQFLDVLFDEKRVRFSFEELDRLTLAYAITIHKAQGSEYKAVIVVISNEHLPMAQRHLIYTAVTRGKEHVFLVAEPNALQTAILSDENNRRWQKLTELLSSPL